jgi:hypothetical protein
MTDDALPGMPADTIAADAKSDEAPKPARRRGRPPGRKDTKPRAPRKPPSLKEPLAQAIAMIGMGVATAGMASPRLAYDGQVILAGADGLADALDTLAQQNPAVHSALSRAVEAGAWSGVIGAALVIAGPIAANHGALPAGVATMLGAPEPPSATDVEAAQMMAQAAAHAAAGNGVGQVQ